MGGGGGYTAQRKRSTIRDRHDPIPPIGHRRSSVQAPDQSEVGRNVRAGSRIILPIPAVVSATASYGGPGRAKRGSAVTQSAGEQPVFVSARRNSYTEVAASNKGPPAESVDTDQLALLHTRLRFALETHLWPLHHVALGQQRPARGGLFPEQQEGGAAGATLNRGAAPADRAVLFARHRDQLEKVFVHFANASTSGEGKAGGAKTPLGKGIEAVRMEVTEFVHLCRGVQVVDDKVTDVVCAAIAIASFDFLGVAKLDALSFGDFFEAIFRIAEFKTYDGVCERAAGIENWLRNEFYVNVGQFTTLDVSVW